MRSFLLLSLAVPSLASAATLYVPSGVSTIQQAILNATGGDTIIIADGTYNEKLTIAKDITLRAANAAVYNSSTGQYVPSVILQPSSDGDVFEIDAGVVVVEDISLTGTRTADRGFDVHAATSVTLRRVTIKGMKDSTYNGSAVQVDSTGSLTLEDVWFEGNTTGTTESNHGGAVSVALADSVTITRGVFQNNGSYSGGAVFLTGVETAEITDATFLSNTASRFGGAVAMESSGELILQGGRFQANAAFSGGALYMTGSVKTSVAGVDFSQNSTAGSDYPWPIGGAVRWRPTSTDAALSVSESTFDRNTSAQQGGAIAFETDSNTSISEAVELSRNVFCGNTASSGGGALFSQNIEAILEDQNNAWLVNSAGSSYGGAVRATNLFRFSSANSAYFGNIAGPDKGAAVFLTSISASFYRDIFAYSRKSSGYNGAIDGTGTWSYSENLWYQNNSKDILRALWSNAMDESVTRDFSEKPETLREWEPSGTYSEFVCSIPNLYEEAFAAVMPNGIASNLVDYSTSSTCDDLYDDLGSANYTPYTGGMSCDIGVTGGDFANPAYFADVDGDTFPLYLDCDDSVIGTNPGATDDAGDNIDEDCSGFLVCYNDADHDGYGTTAFAESTITATGGVSSSNCGASNSDSWDDTSNDCNDSAVGTNPDATEIIDDRLDQDCDTFDLCYLDSDGDGYGNDQNNTHTASTASSCAAQGYSATYDDCEDGVAAVHPNVSELLGNNYDDDCEGTLSCYEDLDRDGIGSTNAVSISHLVGDCLTPGYSIRNDDCNDSLAAVNPNATEIAADGVDQNCDTDELCYTDSDGDHHGSTVTRISDDLDCADVGEVASSDDCDDTKPTVYTGATEVCDGLDNNCDPTVPLDETDNDSDGYVECTLVSTGWLGTPVSGGGDCNDASASISPSATETAANGVDQNCDGKEACYVDGDGDTYGATATTLSTTLTCLGTGIAANDGDCNDGSAAIKPLASEVTADGVDQNCDGTEVCYIDADSDGYGNLAGTTGTSSTLSCVSTGRSPSHNDCADSNAAVNPGATEVAGDNLDGNCDGQELCYTDGDRDGYGNLAGTTQASSSIPCATSGISRRHDDCDDSDANINPGETDLPADGINQDCYEGDECYRDEDGDGHGTVEDVTYTSSDLDCTDSNEATVQDDCDDWEFAIHPGAIDDPGDNIDENCSGFIVCYNDADKDGYGAATSGESNIPADEGYSSSTCGASNTDTWDNTGDDCDDRLASAYPGATEVPADAKDQSCDGKEACYVDQDLDGYGNAAGTTRLSTSITCESPGEDDHKTDCTDTDRTIYPSAPEICDGLVNACGGTLPSNEFDDDSDGAVDCTIAASGWRGTPAKTGKDCDDTDNTVAPGKAELCDGQDNNCDASLPGNEVDDDDDGYVECTLDAGGWDASPAKQGLDCDDTIRTTYPGAPDDECSDGVDNDCDTYGSASYDNDGDGLSYIDEYAEGGSDCLVDSDGDSLLDAAEHGRNTDSDSLFDIADTDDDGDLVPTRTEVTFHTDPIFFDTDGDTLPDRAEWSSDWQGTTLIAEGTAPANTDGDALCDAADTDDDGDGIPTDVESNEIYDWNVDGDTLPNWRDLNSDGDTEHDEDGDGDTDWGGDDVDEGQGDTDNDGIPNWADPDNDGMEGDQDRDGLTNGEERGIRTSPTLPDTDGDGISDFEEVFLDGGSATDPANTDGDALIDALDDDDDGDGFLTLEEDLDGNGDPTDDDLDADGIPNYLDLDEDDDGLESSDEDLDGDDDPSNDDTDGDGTPNYLDEDDDGDGFLTAEEDWNGDGVLNEHDDIDLDGIADYLDDNMEDGARSDHDGDGIPSYLEGFTNPDMDSDADGILDYLDPDDDGDGLPTLEEGAFDPDLDGTPNYLDLDSDNDLIPDADEGSADTDGDGLLDRLIALIAG